MSEEERLSLNGYLADLYQAMQIGDIVYEPKNSSELYNLINKLLKENQKYKEVIDRSIEYLESKRIREKVIVDIDVLEGILKEVEHEKSNN